VLLAGLSGLLSLAFQVPFLTGLWADIDLGEGSIALSTPMVFDIGVYLTVFGTFSAVALALEDEGEE
jgi:multicomponent Na+:H+ antiporter subunit B